MDSVNDVPLGSSAQQLAGALPRPVRQDRQDELERTPAGVDGMRDVDRRRGSNVHACPLDWLLRTGWRLGRGGPVQAARTGYPSIGSRLPARYPARSLETILDV